MSRDRKQKYLLYFVLMIVLIAASMFMNSRFVEIDSCLDLGGAWDYDRNICSSECISDGGSWDVEKSICMPNLENN